MIIALKLQLSVDCAPANVTIHWKLKYSQDLNIFDGYHLNYWCNSNHGQVSKAVSIQLRVILPYFVDVRC